MTAGRAQFRMPSLGADMDEGTVLEWLVKPGDSVDRGDVVAVVDTSKAAVDVECFDTGVVREVLVPVGRTVPVGTPLAVIDTVAPARPVRPAPVPEPAVPEPAAAPEPVVFPPARKRAAELGIDVAGMHGTGPGGAVTRADVERVAHLVPAPPTPPRHGPGQRPRVSPHARRLAAELGVDLGAVTGSGPEGPIHARDVRARDLQARQPTKPAAPTPAPTPAPPLSEPRRDNAAMRHTIGALMARAKKEIPHYYLTTTIDMSAAMAWLSEHNRAAAMTERLVPAALLLRAVALAAHRVPELNGYWIDDAFRPSEAVHLGVAIALRGGGLVAPAILGATALSPAEIMRRLRDLVSRSRSGRLRSSELTDATITVTNLGDLGVESVHGVIYPPQVALAGFGAVLDRPWAVHGLLGVRPVVVATLSADHRASDGATGAGFLHIIDQLLQRPEEL
jgi:pyruvate dehydrogenase E2 component (dihydrolipoamide acetyltransferase)